MNADDLRDLLARLPSYSDEEPSGGIVRGRALSRADDAIHVATPYGVVSVPLDVVLHASFRADDATVVTLQLSDPSAVRVVLPVRLPGFPQLLGREDSPQVRLPGAKGWFFPGALFGLGSTMTAGEGQDTATVCGEFGPDATDDYQYRDYPDDPPPGMEW
jgi:hypothetical protein